VWVRDKAGLAYPYCVTSVRPQAPCVLLKLQGVESLTQAQALRESIVSVEETQLAPLGDGEFYYYQVVGLKVRTQAGDEVGTIAQVFFSGGHDIWVVRRGQKEYLIPVTEEIVRSIDIADGQAIIEPIAGLLEANGY
jgi:16S rRNA processing protein RimM